ncbi:unnamed protein product [Blepharisma stoltei]|uniref:FHA domain-containing protein n=1 Tax=Blepharisma stoltei TaxID=1481888 RepID=A0AAU9K3W4_9CILI|nr:unnamed protein product [Blepharisma stoltei]
MVNFKLFLSCCCQYPDENQQEPLPPESHQTKPSSNFIALPLENSGQRQEQSLLSSGSLISENEILTGPKMKFIIVEGNSLPKNTEYRINPGGYEGSTRTPKDGLVYFGNSSEKSDIVIHDSEASENNHMVVRYDVQKKKYFLKDLGEGTGTFVKITKPFSLKNGNVVSFGESHMLVQLNSANSDISLKFLEGPKADEVLSFTPDDSDIQIGRIQDCKVVFNDSSLSRYQLILKFQDQVGWILEDGNGVKGSTNGTWLFAEDFFEIHDGLLFKVGQTLFLAKTVEASMS